MIVKNESKIITRCLDSVIDYIDYYVICDTGSTDDTKQIIQNYFNTKTNKNGEKIQGELYDVPWRDFGYNRTKAVQLSKNKADYLLLMDADFILIVEDPFFKGEPLDKQVYFVKYAGGSVDYQQLLFIKADQDWAYQGRTHEHLVLEGGNSVTCANMPYFKIEHPGDGGSKAEKHERDRDLLLLDLQDMPSNTRTVFYLAQSYFALKDWQNALKYYQQRVDMGGKYKEEIYLSSIYALHCQRNLDTDGSKFNEILEGLVKAYYFRPTRLEALYTATKYCREHGRPYLGYLIGSLGINTPYPTDKLFVDKAIHNYGLLTEVLQCAYIINHWQACYTVSERLLQMRDTFQQSYLDNLQKINQVSKNKISDGGSIPIQSTLQNDTMNLSGTNQSKEVESGSLVNENTTNNKLPITISICEYQHQIIQNNQRKLASPIENKQKILILGNFMSYNMNRGISNNRIKFLHYISSQPDNNIIIQGLHSKYFLQREFSLATLLNEIYGPFGDDQKNQPDLIIFYLMGTTDHYLGNPFKQDFQQVTEERQIRKMIWIEDIQYLKVYRGFIALNEFQSILLGSKNTEILQQYQLTFPELKISCIEQYIDHNVFRDYNQKKEYDLLFYGCPSSVLYPLRNRLYNICQQLQNEGNIRVKIIEHPGYSNNKAASGEGSIVNEELSKIINSSYLTICTKSNFDFLLKKYMEAGLSKSIILGDIPTDYQNLREDIYLVEINRTMADDQIIEKIKQALTHKSLLENRVEVNYEYFQKHYTYEIGYEKFSSEITNLTTENINKKNKNIQNKTGNQDAKIKLEKNQKQETIQESAQSRQEVITDPQPKSTLNCFVLPRDLGIKRDILQNELQHIYYKDHTKDPQNPDFFRDPTVETKPLEPKDIEQYDDDTVFYDVFFDHKNEDIIALGPAMVNLGQYLNSTVGSFADNPEFENDKKINPGDIRVEQSKLNIKIIFKNPLKNFPNFDLKDPTSRLYIRLSFPRLQYKSKALTFDAEIKPNNLSRVVLSMTTIQKNNKPEWIYDWIRYYYNQGVDRVIIYDNNSDQDTLLEYKSGVQKLCKQLQKIEVIIVNWNFKYGPYRSTYNQFCQTAQILHAMLKYGMTDWMINLDIDEYFVHQEGLTLKEYVTDPSLVPNQINVIYADSYNVANVLDEELDQVSETRTTDYNQLSLDTFKYRFKTRRGFNHKYIVKPDTVIFCGPHDVISRNDPDKNKRDAIQADKSPLYFYHYVGLTVNWKPFEERERKVIFNPAIFYPDKLALQLLKQRRREFNHINIYAPNSLELPRHYKQKRQFYKRTTDLEGVEVNDGIDYNQYDKWTIFYDVFFTVDNRQIIALAPNMVNLEQFLIKFEVYCKNSDTTDDKNMEYEQLQIIRTEKTDVRVKFIIKPPESLNSLNSNNNSNNTDLVNLKFVFPGLNKMEWKIQIYPNNRTKEGGVNLSLTTIQKDNQIHWIHDWIQFYYYQGVREVILYDNDSQNREQLLQSLEDQCSTLLPDLKITVVLWDFLYGPHKSVPNQFCQPGSLTHSMLYYGDSKWMINADIDEYMMCNTTEDSLTLIEYLDKRQDDLLKNEISLIRVDSYIVYNVLEEGSKAHATKPEQLTFRDFKYRANKLTNDNHKYILRPWAAMFAKAHEARMSWGQKIDVGNLIFYHYVGLTTNWKPHLNRTHQLKYQPSDIYVTDQRANQFFQTRQKVVDVIETGMTSSNTKTVVANNVFLYWETYKGKNRAAYLDMCLETVYHHLSQDFHVVVLTPENIGDYLNLSELHSKWNQIPLPPQKSDYIRVAALYQLGGFWLDFDTIVMKSFKPWLDILYSLQDNGNKYMYDVVFGDFQVFGVRKGSIFLERCLDRLHLLLDGSKDLNFKWNSLGGAVTGPIMEDLERDGTINVYRPPKNELCCKQNIGWEVDNDKTGFFSHQDFDLYYQSSQVVVRLHNSMYLHKYVGHAYTKEIFLDERNQDTSNLLFTKFYKKSMGLLSSNKTTQNNNKNKNVSIKAPKQKYVIISSDSKEKYARHVPIVAYLWKYLIGYTPVVFFIEGGYHDETYIDNNGQVEDFVFQKTREVGCKIVKVRWDYAGFKKTGNLAQNIRLFACQLLPNLEDDDYLIITDADMYPLSKAHFNYDIDFTKDFHILNAQGMSPDEIQYPMCYLGGYVSTWKEILGDQTIHDSALLLDQPYITKLIKKWTGFPNRVQRHNRPLDPAVDADFHMVYTDRIDKNSWRGYQDGDIDAHIFKSTKIEHWKKLETLVDQIGMLSRWAKEYFDHVYQVESITSVSRTSNEISTILPITTNPESNNINEQKHIFMYWEDKVGQKRPDYLNLCYETIKKHAEHDGIKIILITPENVQDWIPNLHPDWSRIKVISHKTDYIRVAAVYHHGGFYADFDTVLMKSIQPWFDKLAEVDESGQYKYDLIFAGSCLFGARKGDLYLKKYLELIHKLYDDTPSMTFKWTQFYDEIGGPLKKQMINEQTLRVYNVPITETQPKIPIPWNKDNTETGWISTKLKVEDYYNPNQISLILHNNVYPESFKQMTKKEILTSNMLLSSFIKKSFYDYIQKPLSSTRDILRHGTQNEDNLISQDFDPKTFQTYGGLVNINYLTDWKEEDKDKQLEIKMTVALPAYNAKKIIWLALESLKNQNFIVGDKDEVNFGWELIILEESGYSGQIVKEFVGKLPNCQRIVHGSLDKKILLIEKWIQIAKLSTYQTSKIYVLHAADCYSPPNRLAIHYYHFTNSETGQNCLFSTQKKGLFYNILSKQKVFYDGETVPDHNKKVHLNMALRTKDMLRIPSARLNRWIDNYILTNIKLLNKTELGNHNLFFDHQAVEHITQASDNWKYSLDTDGYNNISDRKQFFNQPSPPFRPYSPDNEELNYESMSKYIPKNVLEFLETLGHQS